MIPRLASPTDLAASGKRSFFKRGAGEPVGCDPRIFANEVCACLMRALEVKGAAPVKAKQKPGVTANAPKSQGAPPQGARPPVVPGRVPPVQVTKQPLVTGNAPPSQAARPPVVPSQVPPLEVTKHPLVTANTAEWQEASVARRATAGWGEAKATGHDEPGPLRVASALRRAHGQRTQHRTARR